MAALMGLQHAFCMVGSLVTVPFVIFKFSFCHGVAKHKIALEAVLVTVQYHMDNRSKLFEALASSTNFYRIKNVFAATCNYYTGLRVKITNYWQYRDPFLDPYIPERDKKRCYAVSISNIFVNLPRAAGSLFGMVGTRVHHGGSAKVVSHGSGCSCTTSHIFADSIYAYCYAYCLPREFT
jgi:hypothetical protein